MDLWGAWRSCDTFYCVCDYYNHQLSYSIFDIRYNSGSISHVVPVLQLSRFDIIDYPLLEPSTRNRQFECGVRFGDGPLDILVDGIHHFVDQDCQALKGSAE